MGAREVLEFLIKQTTSGDGVTKFTGQIKTAKGGLTDFEKAVAGTRSTIGGMDRDIMLLGTNLGSAADALSGFGISIPTSPMQLFGKLTREAAEFLWEATEIAGNAAEQQSLFQQTFRNESEETRAELEEFGDEVGRSSVDLMDMASGIQTILAPMGMARDEAANWSVAMARLATDLGSAFNAMDTDVLRDIRSGLMGSTEVMEKYGVNLKMIAINQELVNMGIEGGVQAATEQEKVQARLNLIMQQTADYQGQAARESEGFNGSMKALEASVKDLNVAIGDELLPTMTEAVSTINELVQGMLKQKDVNETTQASWELLQSALESGKITQGEYNNELDRMYDLIAEGSLKGLEKQHEDLYGQLVLTEEEIEFINLDLGFYADQAARAGTNTAYLGDETAETDMVLRDLDETLKLAYSAIRDQNLGLEEQIALTNELKLVTGELTVNDLALQGAVGTLTAAWASGAVKVDAYHLALQNLNEISGTTMDEIGGIAGALAGLPREVRITIIRDYYDLFGGTIGGSGGSYGTGEGNDDWTAEGGDVQAGSPLIVGELGPESFVPATPGYVVSNRDLQNGAGGGGTTIAFYGPAYFRTEQETRTLIERVMTDAMRGR